MLNISGIEKENIKLEGGSEIRQPFVFDKLPTGWYGGQDTHDVSQKATQTAMRFDWKFAYASVNIPITELLMNAGAAAASSLVTSKMQTAEASIREMIATSLFSDGTGAGGKELIGLKAAVNDTGSYGGIARTSTEGAVLKSFVDATGGPATLDLFQKAYGQATVMPEAPDLIVTTQTVFDRIWAQAQSAQRFTTAPGMLGEVGFSSIRFNRADIVVDQSCPSGEAYFLNSKWIKMVFHPQRQFEVEGPYQTAQQDVNLSVPI
jgi:hypothetical protein